MGRRAVCGVRWRHGETRNACDTGAAASQYTRGGGRAAAEAHAAQAKTRGDVPTVALDDCRRGSFGHLTAPDGSHWVWGNIETNGKKRALLLHDRATTTVWHVSSAELHEPKPRHKRGCRSVVCPPHDLNCAFGP